MKFFGKVGFWEDDVETSPGVYKPKIVEKPYSGDVVKDFRRFQSNDMQNSKFTVNNKITILGDLYAHNNWGSIKYVVWNDIKWAVSSVDVDYPRLTFDLGDVYNENEATQTT